MLTSTSVTRPRTGAGPVRLWPHLRAAHQLKGGDRVLGVHPVPVAGELSEQRRALSRVAAAAQPPRVSPPPPPPPATRHTAARRARGNGGGGSARTGSVSFLASFKAAASASTCTLQPPSAGIASECCLGLEGGAAPRSSPSPMPALASLIAIRKRMRAVASCVGGSCTEQLRCSLAPAIYPRRGGWLRRERGGWGEGLGKVANGAEKSTCCERWSGGSTVRDIESTRSRSRPSTDSGPKSSSALRPPPASPPTWSPTASAPW
eukprot:COSAG01_NODE_339_length_18653_cov_21.648378_5_plen_263_part_00